MVAHLGRISREGSTAHEGRASCRYRRNGRGPTWIAPDLRCTAAGRYLRQNEMIAWFGSTRDYHGTLPPPAPFHPPSPQLYHHHLRRTLTAVGVVRRTGWTRTATDPPRSRPLLAARCPPISSGGCTPLLSSPPPPTARPKAGALRSRGRARPVIQSRVRALGSSPSTPSSCSGSCTPHRQLARPRMLQVASHRLRAPRLIWQEARARVRSTRLWRAGGLRSAVAISWNSGRTCCR